ncbi:hypothetical protein EHF33_00650 [Deinococcus psychrotolerans]|uniref:Uncharacterized protein n=1 Tax=Deinococcus psychrotolerans TaxID=2489213 RepID=A0A3G8Y8D6_9DEIO|nr:hypothetical protein [Deinococcus psychrotolerans]AZI41445.1 hypothetical protein EHF33_00650 [Deinococcus psychrotolerans]
MAGRFGYLDGQKVSKRSRPKKKHDKTKPDPNSSEPLEIVYVRKEILRAVWKEVKQEGGESVSELVDELLSAWLQTRAEMDSEEN